MKRRIRRGITRRIPFVSRQCNKDVWSNRRRIRRRIIRRIGRRIAFLSS
jgi:hypothetical protein